MTTELTKNELEMENPSGQEELEALAVTLDIAETSEEPQASQISQEVQVPESVTEPVDSETTVELELPPGVTEEPQHVEHMDLTKVQGHRKWVKAYLHVSDDEGDLLGNKKMEKEVIQLCKELASLDLEAEEEPDALIEKVKGVITRYSKSVNLAENTSVGTVTKYRIRMGMLFNFLKVLVKKKLGPMWTVWFKRNFGESQFRSAEDYMRIAEVPNAIRYAVFGKERLIAILPHIKGVEGDDPVGGFLSEHGIEFDPETPSDVSEIKLQTDIAIGMKRLAKVGVTEISREKVEAFVSGGKELEPKHVRALKAAKDAGEDVGREMGKLIASGGKVEPRPDTPEAKAENFRKALDRVLDLAKDALRDKSYLSKVNIAHLRALKYKLRVLEHQVAAISMPN